VSPGSIPDWLAVVGDSADGFPGIPGWGAKSASAVLSTYKHLQNIPADPGKWQVASISPGRASTLAQSLASHREEAQLFRKLATLREDVPLTEKLDDLKWRGAYKRLKDLCHAMGEEKLPLRIQQWR
jgi:5'-3' exonuclease